MRDALGMTSDRVYQWLLLLEEYGPEIIYIKGIDNTVADAISRLEYDPKVNPKDLHYTLHYCHSMATMLSHYTNNDEINDGRVNSKMCNVHIFENTKEDEDIYPLTIAEIADAQRSVSNLKLLFKDKDPKGGVSEKVLDDVEVLVYDNSRLVIPGPLQDRAVQW